MASERLSERAWKQAIESTGLVLGVDDFAIKKGHTYNTGIHDLRGGTLLDILPGRKLEELRAYTRQYPGFLLLTPKAVVMDLARGYHTWISECFPNAIRIADRFHIHGYIIEAIQEVCKTVQGTLAPRAKAILKANHGLLHAQERALSAESKAKLDELLGYSDLLREVWTWKEEIINYHRCRWTNATAEGRHNRIKAFQRRHYFTRNRDHYKAGILVEYNRNRIPS
ncbi:Transposase [Paenibacillus algorifonticola]|uniref:Transposase n=1 Tax=Paenibacillus algorifonticola TaxID=684063 RepID=A0A1I2FG08_9BACL|nr:transposase [Paenibacillus algorifonticola]SFF04342.1 Transposase [Paenibacillus algorifonticola]